MDFNAPSITDQFKNNSVKFTPTSNNNGAGDNTNSDDKKTDVNNDEGENAKPKVEPTVDMTDWKAEAEKLQKELEEAKKNIIVQEKVLTPEEIEAKQKQEHTEFLNWLTTDRKLSALEYEKAQEISSKPSRDYLFEKYKALRKSEDSNVQDNEIEIDFDTEYNLNSDNPKVLERAQEKLDIIANKLKKEEIKSFEGLTDEFKLVKETKSKVDVYRNLVDKAAPTISIPFKFDNIDEEIVVDVDYSDIMDEIKGDLKTPEIFKTFTAKDQDTEKNINDYIVNEAMFRKIKNAANTALKKAYDQRVASIKLGSIAPAEIKVGTGDNKEDKYKEVPGIMKQLKDANIIKDNPTQK